MTTFEIEYHPPFAITGAVLVRACGFEIVHGLGTGYVVARVPAASASAARKTFVDAMVREAGKRRPTGEAWVCVAAAARAHARVRA